ncbi:MAG TPA: tetratricopeptide repeat protein [Vicinamibacterales bacterium]|jgi:tetratricopeptide (TPR) repeat protein
MAENPRIEELRRRVQADPASIAFAALAEEFRRAGRYAEAIETCRTGLQRHPSYLSARVTLGRSLVEVGQFNEAREVLEHVLRAAPENLAAIRALADIHERQGETPEALEQYRAALHVASQDSPAEEATAASPAAAPATVTTPTPTKLPVRTLPEWATKAQPAAPRIATLEPEPSPRADDDGARKTLDDLERFLASIQSARRSISSDNSGIAAR